MYPRELNKKSDVKIQIIMHLPESPIISDTALPWREEALYTIRFFDPSTCQDSYDMLKN